MDNLFSSVKFRNGTKNDTSSKVLTCGVARKSGRGVSSLVFQEEEKNETKKQEVVATLKGAVIKGDENQNTILSLSIYNTKLVYFLANCPKEIK